MGTLKERIGNDTEAIMRAKDLKKLIIYRTLNADILAVEKTSKKEITDEEVMQIIQTTVKQKKETILEAEKINDTATVEKLKGEIEILMQYLPTQLSDDEAKAVIKDVIEKNGFSGKKDMGNAMKAVLVELNGKFDRKKINGIVVELLG